MVLCVMPQVFQGISGEVTVTASSVVRPSSLPSYPFSSYMSRNMFPVRIMDIYWSAVVMFRNNPEATVEATMLMRVFARRVNTLVMLSSMPPAVIAPPKHIAQMISQIVFIIPDIPLVAIRSLIWLLPASRLVLVERVSIAPLNIVSRLLPVSPAISLINSGWNNTAKTVANKVEVNKVTNEGTFFAIMMAVMTGTAINQPEIWNLLPNA